MATQIGPSATNLREGHVRPAVIPFADLGVSMPKDAKPNFEPTTYPAGQPAEELPYEGGEHLPTQPDPTKKPPYEIDDPHPRRPLEGEEPGQEKRRAS
jgi:hypothetical protein